MPPPPPRKKLGRAARAAQREEAANSARREARRGLEVAEFAPEDLRISRVIGEGSFGTVFEARGEAGAAHRPEYGEQPLTIMPCLPPAPHCPVSSPPPRQPPDPHPSRTPSLEPQGQLVSDGDAVRAIFKRVKARVEGADQMGEMELRANVKVEQEAPGACAAFLGFVQVPAGAKTTDRRISEGLWLVWRYEGRKSLSDYISRKDTLRALATDLELDETEVVPFVVRSLLSALASLHAVGMIHRDVKPRNIIICEQTKQLRLIDLGACADLRTGDNFDPKEAIMDPMFCPPEQRVLPTNVPNIAALSSFQKSVQVPLLWAKHRPDRFDVYPVGIIMMQLAIPMLRPDRGLSAFNEGLLECQWDLMRWRRKNSDLLKGQTDLLDADGGVGWELAASLLRPRDYEAEGYRSSGFSLADVVNAPQMRISIPDALKSSFFDGSPAPSSSVPSWGRDAGREKATFLIAAQNPDGSKRDVKKGAAAASSSRSTGLRGLLQRLSGVQDDVSRIESATVRQRTVVESLTVRVEAGDDDALEALLEETEKLVDAEEALRGVQDSFRSIFSSVREAFAQAGSGVNAGVGAAPKEGLVSSGSMEGEDGEAEEEAPAGRFVNDEAREYDSSPAAAAQRPLPMLDVDVDDLQRKAGGLFTASVTSGLKLAAAGLRLGASALGDLAADATAVRDAAAAEAAAAAARAKSERNFVAMLAEVCPDNAVADAVAAADPPDPSSHPLEAFLDPTDLRTGMIPAGAERRALICSFVESRRVEARREVARREQMFIAMLRDRLSRDGGWPEAVRAERAWAAVAPTFSNDPRFAAVNDGARREALWRGLLADADAAAAEAAVIAAAEADFSRRLDNLRGTLIVGSSTWAVVRPAIRDEPWYAAVPTERVRISLFNRAVAAERRAEIATRDGGAAAAKRANEAAAQAAKEARERLRLAEAEARAAAKAEAAVTAKRAAAEEGPRAEEQRRQNAAAAEAEAVRVAKAEAALAAARKLKEARENSGRERKRTAALEAARALLGGRARSPSPKVGSTEASTSSAAAAKTAPKETADADPLPNRPPSRLDALREEHLNLKREYDEMEKRLRRLESGLQD